MRIALVIGKLTMNRTLADIVPGSYLLVRPCGREALAGALDDSATQPPVVTPGAASGSAVGAAGGEELVLYDDLGAREGDLAGMVEGREACQPFVPKRVPFDAYNACILDSLEFKPVLETQDEGKP